MKFIICILVLIFSSISFAGILSARRCGYVLDFEKYYKENCNNGKYNKLNPDNEYHTRKQELGSDVCSKEAYEEAKKRIPQVSECEKALKTASFQKNLVSFCEGIDPEWISQKKITECYVSIANKDISDAEYSKCMSKTISPIERLDCLKSKLVPNTSSNNSIKISNTNLEEPKPQKTCEEITDRYVICNGVRYVLDTKSDNLLRRDSVRIKDFLDKDKGTSGGKVQER